MPSFLANVPKENVVQSHSCSLASWRVGSQGRLVSVWRFVKMNCGKMNSSCEAPLCASPVCMEGHHGVLHVGQDVWTSAARRRGEGIPCLMVRPYWISHSAWAWSPCTGEGVEVRRTWGHGGAMSVQKCSSTSCSHILTSHKLSNVHKCLLGHPSQPQA